MKIAVIGTGNGGQAIAAHMASIGHDVNIYGRNQKTVSDIQHVGRITLHGCLEVEGKVSAYSCLESAVAGCEVIMIATTATAHYDLAIKLSSILDDNQIILLNPGRTCGAIEFKNTILECGCKKRIYVAEAQTLVYACRLTDICTVNVIGVKDRVLLAAYPACDTNYIIERLKPMYQCFYPAENVFRTSFENIGAIFHPAVVLFNEAAIERGQQFYFYRDMTDGLSNILEAIDQERISVAKAYGLNPISAKDWVSYAYTGVKGDNLCERMRNNPAYYEILSPTTIKCRQITEDIPTGIVPMSELGKVVGVKTPLFDSLVTMCSTLLNVDFRAYGRNLTRLGFDGMNRNEILKTLE